MKEATDAEALPASSRMLVKMLVLRSKLVTGVIDSFLPAPAIDAAGLNVFDEVSRSGENTLSVDNLELLTDIIMGVVDVGVKTPRPPKPPCSLKGENT